MLIYLRKSLPIILGDPRKLSAKDLTKCRGFADWLQLMENLYGIMTYRQDLAGFGEPQEGMWDGFQRINTDTKQGGIAGVFRHGSMETKRQVTINYLDPVKMYTVKRMSGDIVITASGKALNEKGFEVGLEKMDDGELFEISEQ